MSIRACVSGTANEPIYESDLKLVDEFVNLLNDFKFLYTLRLKMLKQYREQKFGSDQVHFAIISHNEYVTSLDESINKCYETIVNLFQERIDRLFQIDSSDECHSRLDDIFITQGRTCPIYVGACCKEYEFRAIPLFLGSIEVDNEIAPVQACLLIDPSVSRFQPMFHPTGLFKLNCHVVFICQSLDFGQKLVVEYTDPRRERK